MNIEITLKGTSPLLMHNPRMVDPQYELNRAIKAISGKRKKTDEDLRAIERLEWYGGLYDDGGIIVQPTSKVRKCLIEAGRTRKLGRQVERAMSFAAVNVPLEFDGPKKIDDVYADKRYHSRLSVGIGNKRVMRVRPQFYPWALTLKGLFLPIKGLEFSELKDIVEDAGITIGIGDNRVNGYGRFRGSIKEVK